jgi:hypothetical protein
MRFYQEAHRKGKPLVKVERKAMDLLKVARLPYSRRIP